MNPITSLPELYAEFQRNGRLVLRVKVILKSAESTIVALMSDGTVKIRVAAAPEKGRANEELIHFLAEDFGTARENIRILSGASDPLKLVEMTKG